MTGAGILKIIMDITMVHTVSDHRGIGAAIIIHGTGMHGHIIALGDSTDGIITTAGTMTLGTTAGMTLGITEVPGASTILGTMADGMADGIHIILIIMPDGTVVSDGIHTTIIITTIILATLQEVHRVRIISEDRDIRQVL